MIISNNDTSSSSPSSSSSSSSDSPGPVSVHEYRDRELYLAALYNEEMSTSSSFFPVCCHRLGIGYHDQILDARPTTTKIHNKKGLLFLLLLVYLLQFSVSLGSLSSLGVGDQALEVTVQSEYSTTKRYPPSSPFFFSSPSSTCSFSSSSSSCSFYSSSSSCSSFRSSSDSVIYWRQRSSA